MGLVYAILKNGMWDDPGVANAGSIALSFQSEVEAAGLTTGRVAPYLTWRFCYLVCGVFLSLVRCIVGWPANLNGGGEKYTNFLKSQLPEAVDIARFDGLVTLLKLEDFAVWALSVASLFFLAATLFSATPATAIKKAKVSRRLIWIGWLSAFAPPFFFFLAYPLRSAADWDGVLVDVCAFGIDAVFKMPGSDLKRTMKFAASNGMIDASLEGVLGQDTRAAWCQQQGPTWHATFYGVSVGCTWSLEDACQEHYCVPDGASLAQCLPKCLLYAQNLVSVETLREQAVVKMTECGKRFTQFHLASPPKVDLGTATERESMIALYNVGLHGQRVAILEASKVVTLASVQAEFVVGVLIALVAGRYLVPSAFSLLGGLAEALLNSKAIFPGSQHSAWILILTTCEVVPVYAALLAMFQQLVGDAVLAVACVLGTAFSGLGIVTGCRILHIKNGEKEREKMYKLIWFEYALRVLCAVGIVTALVFWATVRQNGLASYVEDTLLTPEVIALGIVDTLAKKILTAVAGTDFVIEAFVSTEMWALSMSEAEKESHAAEVLEFHQLASHVRLRTQAARGNDGLSENRSDSPNDHHSVVLGATE